MKHENTNVERTSEDDPIGLEVSKSWPIELESGNIVMEKNDRIPIQ